VLAIDPRLAVSNLVKVDGFLRMTEIHSTSSFGGGVKLSVPFHKILRHVKEPYEHDRDTS
jgi:hypothetical protein